MVNDLFFSDSVICVECLAKAKFFKNRVLFSAIPGISAISKICGDVFILEKKAQKIFSIFSEHFLPLVTIREDSTIKKSSMDVYFFNENKTSFFILDGSFDVDDKNIFLICNSLFSFFNKLSLGLIVSLAGIGFEFLPDKNDVYLSGNSKEVLNDFSKRYKFKNGLCNHVSFIYGLNGTLLTSDIDSICILIDTLKAPNYFGFIEAKKLLSVIEKLFGISFCANSIKDQILKQKEFLNMIREETKLLKENADKQIKTKVSHSQKDSLNYIG